MAELKRCTKCLIPETHETIHFDEMGVCNICRQHEYKREAIDWEARRKEIGELIESYRGKYDYDCIVPFSGGKDSTFTLYHLVKEYGLKPLVVRFDHGFLRPRLHENALKTFRALGVDVHTFTPNWKVVQKLMLRSFLEKGDFCWHCHTGIFAYPMWVALEKNVPLIIWGEPSAEYTAYYGYDQDEEVDEKRFNRFVNLGISAQDMVVRLGGDVDERDMKPFSYPPLKMLRKLGYRSICLGSYIRWDVKRQSELIARELGWQGDQVEGVPPGYEYEKIECHMQGVRDYIKYIKRGYARSSHLTSLDIRNGRMSREDALKLVERYEGRKPAALALFLEFVGLTEEEFMRVALAHGVSPYEHNPADTKPADLPWDYDQWPRHGGMPRAETEEMLARWERSHGRGDG